MALGEQKHTRQRHSLDTTRRGGGGGGSHLDIAAQVNTRRPDQLLEVTPRPTGKSDPKSYPKSISQSS